MPFGIGGPFCICIGGIPCRAAPIGQSLVSQDPSSMNKSPLMWPPPGGGGGSSWQKHCTQIQVLPKGLWVRAMHLGLTGAVPRYYCSSHIDYLWPLWNWRP